ncbi:MAG: GAF domain-containing protein [Anaerolineae bacterium]|nr:GAF domain-containing protein [Anaerolineae bacterium]
MASPANDNSFLALHALARSAAAATSATQLADLITEFLQPRLGDVQFTLTAPAASAGLAQVPLPGGELSLVIDRKAALTDEESALIALVASLVRAAPPAAAATRAPAAIASLRPEVLALLTAVSEKALVVHDLETIYDLVAARFPEAFPGVTALLLFWQGTSGSWRTAATFGAPARQFPATLLHSAEPAAETQFFRASTDPPARGWPSTYALIPLRAAGAPAALLVAAVPPHRALQPEDFPYLELLAVFLAMAVHSTTLIEEAWQRTARMEMIYSVTDSARALKPLRATLAEIHAQIARAFDVPAFYIALYDPKRGLIDFPYVVDSGQTEKLDSISIDDENSLVAWVVRNDSDFVSDDWQNDPRRPVRGYEELSIVPRSILCLRLRAGKHVAGVFSVQSDEPNAFDKEARALLSSIADQVAVIVRNAQLYSTTRELVDSLAREYLTASTLRQNAATIGTSLDREVILARLLRSLREILPHEVAAAAILENRKVAVIAEEGIGHGDEDAVSSLAGMLERSPLIADLITLREPIVIGDLSGDSRWIWPEAPGPLPAWLGAPLLAGDTLVGVLIMLASVPGTYGEREAWVATTLASHAALAIQNARLHEAIQQQLDELTTLYDASATITADLDQETVLRTVVEQMVRAVPIESCTILVWEENRQALRIAAHQQRPGQRQPLGLTRLDNFECDPVLARVIAAQEVYVVESEATAAPDEETLLDAAGLSALLLIPLVQRGEALGLLALGKTAPGSVFRQSEKRLARNLAAQAAVAVEHARLYTQAQRRVRELGAFHQIVLQLNTPLQLEEVLDNIAGTALRLVEADHLQISLYDAELQAFTVASALSRDGQQIARLPQPELGGLIARLVREGEPFTVENVGSHPALAAANRRTLPVAAIAGYPLKYSGRVIGALTASFREPHRFSQDELLLLDLFSSQAAVAAENTRIFNDAQQRLRSMSALVEMAQQVTGNLRLERVTETTVRRLQELLTARASTIALISPDGSDLEVVAAAGVKPQYRHVRIKLGEGVSGRAIKEMRTIYVRDTRAESDFLFFDPVLRSLLVVPLVARNKVIGTLTVDSDRPHAFNASDIQLMTIAAAQVSVAIANARLFEEVEERAAELAGAYDELKESDRLKDELVQNVSHELRTPLTFIRGYVDLLVDGEMGPLDPEQHSALQIIAHKTGEVTRLVEDIMSLQRIRADNLLVEEFSMHDLLLEEVECHRLTARSHGLELLLEAPAGKVLVTGDRGRITQVLDNLISNALKFSPDGGAIRLILQEQEEWVQVTVADDGIGVPPDKLTRIFERFYQIDGSSRRRFGGTGIGLAIVKRILDAHHGEIWVESKVGRGSRFTFQLPRRSRRMSGPADA